MPSERGKAKRHWRLVFLVTWTAVCLYGANFLITSTSSVTAYSISSPIPIHITALKEEIQITTSSVAAFVVLIVGWVVIWFLTRKSSGGTL